MITFVLVLVFISAALSLLSYVYCWNDIMRGRPHIISLRQILTVMDRHELNRIFGKPEPGYYYKLSPEQVVGLARARTWHYHSECAADIACLLGSWMYMTGYGQPGMAPVFALMAVLCQGINLAFSIWLIRKWGAQILEEIENTED